MKRIKRAAAIFLAAALTLGLLCGCGEDASDQEAAVLDELSVCLGSSPVSLDPAYATEAQDLTLISHLYENLMKVSVDETGAAVAVPAMAKSYEAEKNVDGSVTYTFRLRSAKWSDGTAVTANDFVYAWQRLADPATNSPNARLLSIVAGFDEVQATGDVTALQVEAKNNSTLIVTITGTCEWFLTDVCTAPAASPLRRVIVQRLTESAVQSSSAADAAAAPAPDAWASDYTHLVTNGPYCVDSVSISFLTLAKNERYTGNDDGPRAIRVVYADTPEDGWALYESGTVDFLAELPESQLQILAEDPEWTPIAEPTTCVLLFNTASEPLSDPLVRQALQLAIDRTALSTSAGTACLPAGGLVSSSVPDADEDAANFRAHGGDLVNCDPASTGSNRAEAQQALESAGYDLEFSLPMMELLYPDTERHAETARQLAEMWSISLNAAVTPVAVEESQLDSLLSSGQYKLALTDLTALANDAQSFLDRWTTDDTANVVRYSNSAFDTLLTVISSASDDSARRGCLHDAESLLLEDCPLTPLYFTGTAYALRESLTGLVRDARGTFLFSGITQLAAAP